MLNAIERIKSCDNFFDYVERAYNVEVPFRGEGKFVGYRGMDEIRFWMKPIDEGVLFGMSEEGTWQIYSDEHNDVVATEEDGRLEEFRDDYGYAENY